jgi:hypothetical protein
MPFERGGYKPEKDDWLNGEPVKPKRTVQDALKDLERFPIAEHPKEIQKRALQEARFESFGERDDLTRAEEDEAQMQELLKTASEADVADEVVAGEPDSSEIIPAALARDRARRSEYRQAAKHVADVERNKKAVVDSLMHKYGALDAKQEALMTSTSEKDVGNQARILEQMSRLRQDLRRAGIDDDAFRVLYKQERARQNALAKGMDMRRGYVKSLEEQTARKKPETFWQYFMRRFTAQSKAQEPAPKPVPVKEAGPSFLAKFWGKISGKESRANKMAETTAGYRKNVEGVYGTTPVYTSETTLAHMQAANPRRRERWVRNKQENRGNKAA